MILTGSGLLLCIGTVDRRTRARVSKWRVGGVMVRLTPVRSWGRGCRGANRAWCAVLPRGCRVILIPGTVCSLLRPVTVGLRGPAVLWGEVSICALDGSGVMIRLRIF